MRATALLYACKKPSVLLLIATLLSLYAPEDLISLLLFLHLGLLGVSLLFGTPLCSMVIWWRVNNLAKSLSSLLDLMLNLGSWLMCMVHVIRLARILLFNGFITFISHMMRIGFCLGILILSDLWITEICQEEILMTCSFLMK